MGYRGFLDDQLIRFNENVNCFIGDTGSGKSVAAELVRFCLEQQPIVGKIRQEVESLLKQQLGDLGVVHLLLAKGGYHYLVERAWSSTPVAATIQRVSGADLQPVDGLQVSTFFPIKCFSQSEIIEFAREPGVRLSLTDDLIDCSNEFASIENSKAQLRENAASTISEQTKATNIQEQLTARVDLIEDIASIDNILNNSRVEQQQLWYDEQTMLENAKNAVENLSTRLMVSIGQLGLTSPCPDDISGLPNNDILGQVNKALDNWSAAVEDFRSDATNKLDVLRHELEALRETWNVRFQKAEEEYRKLLSDLDEDGIGYRRCRNDGKPNRSKLPLWTWSSANFKKMFCLAC